MRLLHHISRELIFKQVFALGIELWVQFNLSGAPLNFFSPPRHLFSILVPQCLLKWEEFYLNITSSRCNLHTEIPKETPPNRSQSKTLSVPWFVKAASRCQDLFYWYQWMQQWERVEVMDLFTPATVFCPIIKWFSSPPGSMLSLTTSNTTTMLNRKYSRLILQQWFLQLILWGVWSSWSLWLFCSATESVKRTDYSGKGGLSGLVVLCTKDGQSNKLNQEQIEEHKVHKLPSDKWAHPLCCLAM